MEEYKRNEPLREHTTFRIGGEADWYIVPSDIDSLKQAILFCIDKKIPYYIIGKGSNLLFPDAGFRGAVIEIGSGMDKAEMLDERTVRAEAGISLAKLAAFLAGQELTGFEFASGIPGTLGGAVVMNAGAYGGEMKQRVKEVNVLDLLTMEEKVLTAAELNFRYRYSVIQERKLIVLSGTLLFEKGKKEDILSYMKELNRKRKEKQPLEFPSAGSTFKRPENHYAGKLIHDAGLRGYRIGDAQVSEKHCGFVINLGNATAENVRCVIEDVKKTVKAKFGVELEPEIRIPKGWDEE